MKKFTLVMLFLVCATVIFAQSRTGQNTSATPINKEIGVNAQMNKALGDTLFYFDGAYFYVNATDEAAFNFVNEDMDGLVPYNAGSGWTSDWMVFYSTDADDFLNFDVDTAFFLGATSWFNPAGQADNWFAYGPITVPAATGLKLQWYVKCNPAYRDGYKVHASATGMSNYTDFTASALYTRTDLYPSNTQAVDTVWTKLEVNIPSSYNGGPVYIAFQHNANDMDVIFLDEMMLIEAQVLGMEEVNNDVTVSQNFPNPVQNTTMFSYQLTKSANVTVDVLDITGRIVMSIEEGQKSAGAHRVTLDTEKLPNGTYFYTVTVDAAKTTRKMVVVK